jgi:STE24 endopeptidase
MRFADRQDTEPIKVVVEDVSGYTTLPNAYATGIGPSRRVFLWDTLLDGRFDDDEVRVVLAHEIAHHSREHILKGAAWYALCCSRSSAGLPG